ncbi:CHASE2 domain-containing protein [Mesorhizobium sp. 10J20-29]
MNGRALQTLIALALTLLWGVGLSLQHWRGHAWFLDRVEATLSDLRMLARGPRAAPDAVTIIAIDDATVELAGGYPLKRDVLARIVAAIAQAGPRAIAVDLLLVDPGPEPGDAALAAALAQVPSVIAAAAVYGEESQSVSDKGPLGGIAQAERFLMPLKRFGDVAAVGVVNVSTDQSGAPRAVPMLFRSGDDVQSSLPLRVAALAGGQEPVIEPGGIVVGARLVATDAGQMLPLSFYGPRGTIRTTSAADLLLGRVGDDLFRNRVVAVGATVTGGGDVFATPFDPVLPGVEVISTAISHLVTGDGPVRNRATRLGDGIIATLLGLSLVGLIAWRRSAVGGAVLAAVLLLWLAGNMAAFTQGIWLSAALPLAVAVPPVMLFGLAQIWLDRGRAQHFARRAELLQKFQAPALTRMLARDPDFLAKPVRQDAAIVFIDISGFTGLSETLGPDTVRDLLNGFYEMVEMEATACGGTITSFMGDGAMIVFGLPGAERGDAATALTCCVSLAAATRRWLEALPAAIGSRVGFKIGAHFGLVVASRMGGEGHHQQMTATGDTVNVASRLMEVAAASGAEVALSDDLLRAAGDAAAVRATGSLEGPTQVPIRGRAGGLFVWYWRAGAGTEAG